MENIYKIKIRSNPNPQELYPSERRYSSSIILGMSVMFLALAITSSLMGILVVRRITTNNSTEESSNSTTNDTLEDLRLFNKVEKDLIYQYPYERPINMPAIVSSGCFVMSLGLFLAGFVGILAWKQWYIDNNITWFFLSACFASVTSSISLLLIILTLIDLRQKIMYEEGIIILPVSLGLSVNICITSLLALLWSVVASNVSFKGMKNSYPEDMVVTKSGRVQVNTVKKGNKIAKVVPPDILDHFPKTGKLAKYLPRKNQDDGGLPKAESNKEYEDRVKRFLTGQAAEENCEQTKN